MPPTLSLRQTVEGAWKIFRAWLGLDPTPAEIVQWRREICAACPRLEVDRCGVCGCFVHYKTALGAERCPEGRWN